MIAAAFIRRARTGAPSADGAGAPVTEDATGLIVEGGEVMTVDGKPVSESGALLGADDEREGQVR